MKNTKQHIELLAWIEKAMTKDKGGFRKATHVSAIKIFSPNPTLAQLLIMNGGKKSAPNVYQDQAGNSTYEFKIKGLRLSTLQGAIDAFNKKHQHNLKLHNHYQTLS